MATSFPTSKDNFVNPQSTDSPKLISHADQHSNANDAIEALETKVGVDGSTDPDSLEYRLTNYEPAKISFTPPLDGKLGQLWFDNQTAEFYVFDGTYWVQVSTPVGADGNPGPAGPGVAAGGTAGQYLTKVDATDYNTEWSDSLDGESITLKTRRDTQANWFSSNPILAAGEQGYETDTGLTKHGDGTNAWNNLTYSSTSTKTYFVSNNTGSTITKGTLVSAVGAQATGRIDVAPFDVSGTQDSEVRVMGLALTDIATGGRGTVISFGTVRNINTLGTTATGLAVGDETWSVGDILFAHPTVNGKLTKVRPQHDLTVAFVTKSDATTGQLAIRINPGNHHLEWLHDVIINTPIQNNVLSYDATSGVWKNKIVTSSDISDFNEAAQDAIGNNIGAGLTYNDTTGTIGVNPGAMLNQIVDGTSGNSYGLVGTSAYLDVKDTNGYNKEIELDIASVKSHLDVEGYVKTSSSNALTLGTINGSTLGDSGWIAVSSILNGFSTPQSAYYRKINNVVYLRGNLFNGSSGTAAFNLPVGYRPSVESVFPTQKFGTADINYITVGTDGNVVPNSTAGWLNSVVFPV